MKYIIDANNLAGKLKMLGDRNFDKKLIGMIKNYTSGRKNHVALVFDPKDEWGDKNTISDTITAYYSPKDAYYESADDKIVEIINQHLTVDKDELTVITDDVGLRKRIESLMEETNTKINMVLATEYADKMLKALKVPDQEKPDLGEDEQDKIKRELLDIWQ